jgi:hypothetical protein
VTFRERWRSPAVMLMPPPATRGAEEKLAISLRRANDCSGMGGGEFIEVPAICANGHLTPAMRISAGGNARISMWGNQISCRQCSLMAAIPDGFYEIITTGNETLARLPPVAADLTARLLLELRHSSTASERAALLSRLSSTAPELAASLRPFAGVKPEVWVAIFTMLITLYLGKQSNDIARESLNLAREVAERSVERTSDDGQRDATSSGPAPSVRPQQTNRVRDSHRAGRRRAKMSRRQRRQ